MKTEIEKAQARMRATLAKDGPLQAPETRAAMQRAVDVAMARPDFFRARILELSGYALIRVAMLNLKIGRWTS